MQQIAPVVLSGRTVRLVPLRMQHASALFEVAQDQDIWAYMPARPDSSLAAMEASIQQTLAAQQAGRELPFAIVRLEDDRVVGSTRYLDIVPQHRGLEIGWTWLGATARRTSINTECKYLLLGYAFETLGAIRVQLKTDSRNLRSQQAIERLGAIKEGTLRNHIIMPDGYYRHTVYYSIIESEWPQVKARLEARLSQHPQTDRMTD
ncbi:MAG TPA: GNAT family protein [Ktedonobacteraceae bacterium]|jgi:RimJ/RimL family protein N-acetyltransferase|nr:GNAT family protein [Ktedonobacteraceae bacterium]